jgi:hypothetical protein
LILAAYQLQGVQLLGRYRSVRAVHIRGTPGATRPQVGIDEGPGRCARDRSCGASHGGLNFQIRSRGGCSSTGRHRDWNR